MAQSSRYGEAFLQAEDFTGDGVEDLVVCDPGDSNGQGTLYVFYGPVANDPLPSPSTADEIVHRSAPSLLDTGWRIKQACDYNFDGIADIYIGATILHEDGSTDDRVLIVTPVSWRIMADVRSDRIGTSFATGDLNTNGQVDSDDLVSVVLIVENQQ
ncbi:MAG: hypothetical protein ACF8R9_08190 [Phycisphaerales bacterium JB054]